MGLFLDLINLSAPATDGALEFIYKAHHDHGDEGIWKPHESPLIRRLVELFTERGIAHLDGVKDGLAAWHAGHNHHPSPTPVQPPAGMVQYWSADEISLARLYLESLPPAVWTLDDHMLCIELVMQANMPPGLLAQEAEWLATKAAMMGKVQANLAKEPTAKQADAILAAMPSSLAHAWPMPGPGTAVLVFARARAAENVRALTEAVRHRMRALIAADLEQRLLGNVPAGTSSLQTKLLDAFGELNRDWRRIAVTEAGEAQNQGFIASLPYGAKVRRVEQYANACAFCRRIDGVVATVVDPAKQEKDPDTEVWVGKNNLGRSASPRKRVGDVLVEREPHEMWQLPAGLAHPHCRGRWVVVSDGAQPGDDPGFASVLDSILGGPTPPAPTAGTAPG